MLNKQQSEIWKALGHGTQWVLRDELADLQKQNSTESSDPPKQKAISPEAPTSLKTATETKSTPKDSTASALPKATTVSQPSTPSKKPSSIKTVATNAPTSASDSAMLFKPPYGSRKVDIADARATKRIEFIKNADWGQLEEAVYDCTVCDIGKNRLNAVFGMGNPPQDVVLIGEGPGRVEDEQGEIFVGPSGKLLDEILKSVNLKRGKDVAILNTIKCRPPQNANPSEPEMAACRPFLERQLELLDPKLIVVMGRPAYKWIFRKDDSISTQRGRIHNVEVAGKMRQVIVTYHPSYLLRTPGDKGKAWLDWLLVLDTMRKLKNDGKSI